MKETIIKSRGKSGGFTLIEIMVAIAIIGVLAVPLLGAYLNAKKFAEDHYRFTVAASALQKQIEHFKSLKLKDFAESKTLSLGAVAAEDMQRLEGGRITVSTGVVPGRAGVMRIEVKVQWINPWGTSRSLNSVILRASP